MSGIVRGKVVDKLHMYLFIYIYVMNLFPAVCVRREMSLE